MPQQPGHPQSLSESPLVLPSTGLPIMRAHRAFIVGLYCLPKALVGALTSGFADFSVEVDWHWQLLDWHNPDTPSLPEAVLPDVILHDVGQELPDVWREVPSIVLIPGSITDDNCADEAAVRHTLQKPFRFAHLIRTLHTIVQQLGYQGTGALQAYRLSWRQKCLIWHGASCVQSVDLTDREVAVVYFLLIAGEEGASRSALLQHVWCYAADVETQAIETHMGSLRQKLRAVDLDISANNSQYWLRPFSGI